MYTFVLQRTNVDNMQYRFFSPHIGEQYNKGINGKKILVIGASFYCPKRDCTFFQKCTDVTKKDSSHYDKLCPEYASKGKFLHDEPSYAIEDAHITFRRFRKFISKFTNTRNYEDTWSYLAFTNYVQFFLPAEKKYRKTLASDLSARDFKSFIETLMELQPDVVIVWGCVINTCLKEDSLIIDKQELIISEGYLWHIQLPGLNKVISILNPYHPSSRAWYSALPKFENILKEELLK